MSIHEIVRLLKQIAAFYMWKQHEKHLSKHFGRNEPFGVTNISLVPLGMQQRDDSKIYSRTRIKTVGVHPQT
jgi:hypothetical protein